VAEAPGAQAPASEAAQAHAAGGDVTAPASRPSAGPLLIDVSPELAGHIALALGQHRRWAARTGLQLPAGLSEFERHLTRRATQGQRGTPLEDLWAVRDGAHVTARLLAYEDAAAALSVSERTVKRLVARGQLRAVRVAGTARIRVCDLDAYVDHLSTTHTPTTTGESLCH
jgi:excisionase family DNA binding protein